MNAHIIKKTLKTIKSIPLIARMFKTSEATGDTEIDWMKAIEVHLNINQIREPADGALKDALIAEITRAHENIRFSVQRRTQAIYYLIGFMGAAVALIANAITANSFTLALNTRSGPRFIALALAIQFLFWIASLLAAVVYGVVFKANDAVRFYVREISRLNDVLYGYPENKGSANPGWAAIRYTKHDTRDKNGIFSELHVTENLSLGIFSLTLLVLLSLLAIAILQLQLKNGFLPCAIFIASLIYIPSLFTVGFVWIRPLLLQKKAIDEYDSRVKASGLRAIERLRDKEE